MRACDKCSWQHTCMTERCGGKRFKCEVMGAAAVKSVQFAVPRTSFQWLTITLESRLNSWQANKKKRCEAKTFDSNRISESVQQISLDFSNPLQICKILCKILSTQNEVWITARLARTQTKQTSSFLWQGSTCSNAWRVSCPPSSQSAPF